MERKINVKFVLPCLQINLLWFFYRYQTLLKVQFFHISEKFLSKPAKV
jgi:hypothetical protein